VGSKQGGKRNDKNVEPNPHCQKRYGKLEQKRKFISCSATGGGATTAGSGAGATTGAAGSGAGAAGPSGGGKAFSASAKRRRWRSKCKETLP